MARFDLKCLTCGNVLEVSCPFIELDLVRRQTLCQTCDKITEFERIYSAPPVPHFKGSGFYQTDYKGKK
jgi:predicted nucleic acid-binding Zn ribbon protein